MLPLCVAAEKQTVKHGGGIVMLQKVGHAAQGEGNCRAGGTRCCSERKLQAVRMKNLVGNLQPLIYGAFPVWRNCTVRAHICNLGASEWRKRKNGVEYARTFRCRLHAPHLHPCHAPDAGKCSRKDGKFYVASHVKKQRKNTERRRGYSDIRPSTLSIQNKDR